MTFQPIGDLAAGIVEKLAAGRQIERHAITSREQWLALRQNDVTASAAGALLSCHEYMTKFELWALKSGRVADDPEETGPMRRGRLLEPVALQLLREERPRWSVEQPAIYLRDPVARLGATPDAYAWDLDDPDHIVAAEVGDTPPFGIVQVKNVEPSIFRKKWRNEDGTVEPPLWIVIQACLEAHLAGAQWAVVAAMTVGFGVELHIVDIPLHVGIVERLKAEAAEFWAIVESGRAPDFDYARDAAMIAELYGEDNGEEIDLSGENMLPALSDEDARLAEEIKERIARRKAIKAELLAKMQHAARATYNGALFATAKTVRKKAYTVDATSYRDIRFKRSAA